MVQIAVNPFNTYFKNTCQVSHITPNLEGMGYAPVCILCEFHAEDTPAFKIHAKQQSSMERDLMNQLTNTN